MKLIAAFIVMAVCSTAAFAGSSKACGCSDGCKCPGATGKGKCECRCEKK